MVFTMVCLRLSIPEKRTGLLRIGFLCPRSGRCRFGGCMMVGFFWKMDLDVVGILTLAEMYDIATQVVMKWARLGPKTPIMVTDDFTRLTLDTIALCSMGTRFNSFYHNEMHPFVEAMVGLLQGSGDRTRRPALLNGLPTSENAKYWSDITYLRELSQELVNARKENPEEGKKDLLNALILGRDPQTGQGLSDDTIIDNMITFLIAGMFSLVSIAL